MTGLALPRCICGLIGCTVHNHLLVLYDGWAQNTCDIASCQVPSVPGPTISPLTAIPRSRDSWLRTRELKTSWTGHGWVQSSVVPSIVVGGGEIIDGHMVIFILFEHVIYRSDPNHLEAQRRRRHRLFFYRSVFLFYSGTALWRSQQNNKKKRTVTKAERHNCCHR